MEVKQVQYTQSNHAERILRLEKRHADDAALKSVWNSPFPGVIGGTPQQGPVQISHNEIFDDLDEQGEQLLGSLHLGPAEEEPVRRGAASRANSVRFDESALHGSSWGGQSNRQSGDFGPIRPGSGLMMERSLSHKSDGRHSSAGHSVHSHHSVASGRASSLGLDTNFTTGDDDSSSFEIPGPPVSLYVLGTVPSIVRCWLTTNFAHDTLLYADICTGSQKSTVDYSLVKELGLEDHLERGPDGAFRARLDVYLAEAVVTQHCGRSGPNAGSVPSMTIAFEVIGMELPGQGGERKAIRIYIGSDALRAYSADILFSQNKMVLFGNERDRLQVPFVRPEDEGVFRHICTMSAIPERPKLNANATPFVLERERNAADSEPVGEDSFVPQPDPETRPSTSSVDSLIESQTPTTANDVTAANGDSDIKGRDVNGHYSSSKEDSVASDASRRESSATTSGIWGSWRQGSAGGGDGSPLSGYQPAARGGRNMKVLRPLKSNSTSAKPGGLYDSPVPSKPSDGRRKSHAGLGGDASSSAVNGANRWEPKRTPSLGAENRPSVGSRDTKPTGALPRSANPVGGASAFSWMTPSSKLPKASTSAAE
ncbi:hypothetical protein HIM_06535 [Hirsutella minnesotensis 3608]|uniref:Ubiquitin carboxyl-terminal hydrolase 19 n=1 Tax=Hirsutella minnesotensis 3608 TaxID=1043627 RepID=A0A0F7ZJ01_9HYPO|nr:hypothetical protein HIM_06535 [Hirsutella minnesotensis 3608]